MALTRFGRSCELECFTTGTVFRASSGLIFTSERMNARLVRNGRTEPAEHRARVRAVKAYNKVAATLPLADFKLEIARGNFNCS